jgi:hypothetical protein
VREVTVSRLLVALLLLTAFAESSVQAQSWPDATTSFAGGRVTVGGEFTATVSPDDEGKFNYTDYERSALQLIRLGVTINVRPVEGIAFVTELRAEGATDGGPWDGIPVAAYVRVRPWRKRPFDVQIGRIPPVFGVGGRRLYAADNVLIGYPLAWQYLTVMRPDAVPANADELIYARSYGWQPAYSVGSDNYARGVPLATAFRYDTGVEGRIGEESSPVSVAAAFTAGTVSSPGARSSNGGPQFSTRVAVRPATGLILGGSYANGTFIADTVRDTLPASVANQRYAQQTFGADTEYSKGYWLFRSELVSARWTLPVLGKPLIDNPLWSTGVSLEGRYRLMPGVTVGARVDRLWFNDQTGTHYTLPWDAPVSRIEGGVAWSVMRHVILRASLQHDTRTRGPVTSATLPAAQVTLWF